MVMHCVSACSAKSNRMLTSARIHTQGRSSLPLEIPKLGGPTSGGSSINPGALPRCGGALWAQVKSHDPTEARGLHREVGLAGAAGLLVRRIPNQFDRQNHKVFRPKSLAEIPRSRRSGLRPLCYPVRYTVIDTLARAMSGADVNSDPVTNLDLPDGAPDQPSFITVAVCITLRSACTISRARSRTLVSWLQPSFCFALLGSPCSSSTSVGRK